jgi:hypothetical protein
MPNSTRLIARAILRSRRTGAVRAEAKTEESHSARDRLPEGVKLGGLQIPDVGNIRSFQSSIFTITSFLSFLALYDFFSQEGRRYSDAGLEEARHMIAFTVPW